MGVPRDEILDFVSDTLVAEFPLDEAGFSIIEIRTLGGPSLRAVNFPRVIFTTCFSLIS